MTGVHHGTGQHANVIPADELPQGLKVCLILCYAPHLSFTLAGYVN